MMLGKVWGMKMVVVKKREGVWGTYAVFASQDDLEAQR